MLVFVFYSVFNQEIKCNVCSHEVKLCLRQFQEFQDNKFFWMLVKMTELYVHFFVKISFAIFQRLKVILKPNTKKLLLFFHTKSNQFIFFKKLFAYSDFKNVSKALSIYLCKQIFLHMMYVMSSHRSCITADNFEACVQLKFTNYLVSQKIRPSLKIMKQDI